MRIGLCDDSLRDQAAVLAVLKKLGLKADGVAGYNTLQAEFYH